MDKNIIAFVRENAKTVVVRFFPQSFAMTKTVIQALELEHGETYSKGVPIKDYLYLTTLDLLPGDVCMVYVNQYPIAVEVQEVHNDVQIEPNASQEIKWIAARVDMSYYTNLLAENAIIVDTLRKEYQASTRRQFRDMVMTSLTEAGRETIKGILGDNTKS